MANSSSLRDFGVLRRTFRVLQRMFSPTIQLKVLSFFLTVGLSVCAVCSGCRVVPQQAFPPNGCVVCPAGVEPWCRRGGGEDVFPDFFFHFILFGRL